MELWLLLGVCAYLFYAISSSIDKYMMNKMCDSVKTDMFKMFFDGLVMLIIGLLFFDLSFNSKSILAVFPLGIFYAASGILYYNILQKEDSEVAIPYMQSGSLLLVFILSIVLFKEIVSTFNYLGILFILLGMYVVLSKNGFKIPKWKKVFFIIIGVIFLDSIYILLAKKTLYSIEPINLGIMMYFSATIIIVLYQLIFRKDHLKKSLSNIKIPAIFIASCFAAIGSLALYTALSIGNASKVFPLIGLQSVFLFIIATIFLKEKFTWHRLIGTIIVFFGIYFISL